MSHVTCHVSCVIKKSNEVCRWRACYQQGLPGKFSANNTPYTQEAVWKINFLKSLTLDKFALFTIQYFGKHLVQIFILI